MTEFKKILFLDIDGVLNGHEYNTDAESNTIKHECVKHLNRILAETQCELVISSAWRYMIHGGAMTLQGFGYMLRTHGVKNVKIVGITEKDTQMENPTERGLLIQQWLSKNKVDQYAIVDDMQLGFDGMPFVKTDEKTGLTEKDADQLIRILSKFDNIDM